MNDLISLLDRHPVFASLDADHRCDLAGRSSARDLRKGEVLVHQGDVWPYLFLVSQGAVDALKVSSEGRSLIVTSFPAGELFWGLAFFQEDAPMLVSLASHGQTRIHLWSRDQMMPVFLQDGRLAWDLCRLMIRRMQRASAILEEMAFQPVSGRLARLLIEHFGEAGAVARDLTLEEMAARVGTTREMVCRALYRFADQKLIDVTRTEFVLTDRSGLARLADLPDEP